MTYNKERATMILSTTYKTAMEGNLIPDRETLVTRIGNMIKSPNTTGPRRSRNGSCPGHISMHKSLWERGSCLLRTCLKSWQLHDFKWTNKSTQLEKKLQQITRKFLAKRDKSKFDIKNIKTISTRHGVKRFFSLFYSGINMVPCSHLKPTRQKYRATFSCYSTEESIQYPVAIRFYTNSTSAHQIYFS